MAGLHSQVGVIEAHGDAMAEAIWDFEAKVEKRVRRLTILIDTLDEG